MAQVIAKIVVAQAGNSPPGGYIDGGRDDLVTGSQITLTNADNAGVLGHKWVITPCAALDLSVYGVSGTESPSCTLTPPSPDGYGDAFVELTVFGAPLPNGQPNVSVDRVPLGIRAAVSGYAAGVPIPSWRETSAGGRGTLSAFGGREFRLQEGFYAVVKQIISAGIADATTLRAQNGDDTPSAFVAGGVTIKSVSEYLSASMDVGTKTLSLALAPIVTGIVDDDGNVATGPVRFRNTDTFNWVVDEATGEVFLDYLGGGGGAGVASIEVGGESLTGAVGVVSQDGSLSTNVSGDNNVNVQLVGTAIPEPYTATLVTYESVANSLLITGASGAFVPPDFDEVPPPAVVVRGRNNTATTGYYSSGGNAVLLGGDVVGDPDNENAGGQAIVSGGKGPSAGGAIVTGGFTTIDGGSGGFVSIAGRDGSAHTTLTDVSGGSVNVNGGDGKGTGSGGGLSLFAGSSAAAQGGPVDLGAGTGISGGYLRLRGGESYTGVGGSVEINGGGSNASTGGPVTIAAGANADGADGGVCTVSGGRGGAISNGGSGGALNLTGGASVLGTSKVGGNASLAGGAASGTTGTGGDATVTGGAGSATCGSARLQGGHAGATGVTPGNATVYGGNANAGNVAGGSALIQGGAATGTAQGGSATLTGGGAASGGVSGWASVLGGTGGLTGGRAQVIGGAGTVNTTGGLCVLAGGSASGTGNGGDITATGGASSNTGAGGAVAIAGGAAGATATSKAGGAVSVTGGASAGTTGVGGSATVAGGTGTATGGEVLLTPGLGASSAPARTRVTRGAFVVEESTAVVKQLTETCAPVTTTSTTATLLWSYPLGTSENIIVTCEALADPGTAAASGVVTFKAAFRRTTGDNAGAAQQIGTTQDVSPNGNVPKSSFGLTIALNGNTVEVKAVAPNNTSTLWSAAVGALVRTGPV